LSSLRRASSRREAARIRFNFSFRHQVRDIGNSWVNGKKLRTEPIAKAAIAQSRLLLPVAGSCMLYGGLR
jgi:hypothetical protein